LQKKEKGLPRQRKRVTRFPRDGVAGSTLKTRKKKPEMGVRQMVEREGKETCALEKK